MAGLGALVVCAAAAAQGLGVTEFLREATLELGSTGLLEEAKKRLGVEGRALRQALQQAEEHLHLCPEPDVRASVLELDLQKAPEIAVALDGFREDLTGARLRGAIATAFQHQLFGGDPDLRDRCVDFYYTALLLALVAFPATAPRASSLLNRIDFMGLRRQVSALQAELQEARTPALQVESGSPRHNLRRAALGGRFVGRSSDRTWVREQLSLAARQSPPPVVALTGPPGMGKSQLALEVAHELLSELEFVVWAEASADGPAASLAAVAGVFRTDGSVAESDEESRARSVRWALERGGEGLLIVDNLEAGEPWQDLLPSRGRCRVLVTSRGPTGLAGEERTRRLGPLCTEDGARILGQGLDLEEGSEEEAAAQELAAQLAGLPLALQVVATMLSSPGLTPAQVVDIVERSGTGAVLGLGTAPPGTGTQHDLGLLVQEALRRFEPPQVCAALARAVLAVVGWFAPVPLDTDLVIGAAVRLAPPPGSLAAPLVPIVVGQAVQAVLGTGVVHVDPGGRLVVHRLVAEALRGLDDQGGFAAVCEELLARVGSLRQTSELFELSDCREHVAAVCRRPEGFVRWQHHLLGLQLARQRKLRGHRQAGFELTCETLDALRLVRKTLADRPDATATLREVDALAAETLREQGILLGYIERFDEAEESLARALDVGLSVQGPGAVPVLQTLLSIAFLYAARDRPDECRRRNLFLLREMDRVQGQERRVDGELDLLRFQTLLSLGRSQTKLRELDAALHSFDQAEAVLGRIEDPGRISLANVRNAQGYALGKMRGRLEDAEALNRECLALRVAAFGEVHPTTATARKNLADVLNQRSRFENAPGPALEALALYQEVLEVRRQTEPALHPGIGRTLFDIGAIYLVRLGRPAEAVEPLREAVPATAAARAANPDSQRRRWEDLRVRYHLVRAREESPDHEVTLDEMVLAMRQYDDTERNRDRLQKAWRWLFRALTRVEAGGTSLDPRLRQVVAERVQELWPCGHKVGRQAAAWLRGPDGI